MLYVEFRSNPSCLQSKINILIFQCFFCESEESFKDLIIQLRSKVNKAGHTMFEIYDKPLEDNLTNLEPVDAFNSSDDEFEIL